MLVITEILFCYREIELTNNSKQNEKPTFIYKTCLQYSYSTALCFPYDIIYLPDGCKGNTITFVLPSSNQLNIDSIMKAPESELGFNKSYSKINNFSLMQSLNISSLTDNSLQNLANKILEISTCMCSE